MRRLVAAILLLLAASGFAAAQSAPSFAFAGEKYVRAFEDTNGPDHFMEFTRPGETVENWTRLVTVHHFALQATPQQMAAQLVKNAAAAYPKSDPDIRETAAAGEAMVTFVAAAPGSDTAEINASDMAGTAPAKVCWPSNTLSA